MRAFSRRHALWLLAGLPVACTSPNPTLYTLAVVPGPARTGAPRRIELRAIAMPHYLDRLQIVRSTEDFRLDVLGNDWWGEALDSMMGGVLVQELLQRLPGSIVFPENGAISAAPDAEVEVNVQRFDADRSGAVVLAAVVAVVRHGETAASRTVRFSVMPAGAGTGGFVAAMSGATGQLADVIAGMLVG
ncbi:MAG TPA: PqiC family protein [Acetobacteraceae bacterium]|jgi:hypothetical protein